MEKTDLFSADGFSSPEDASNAHNQYHLPKSIGFYHLVNVIVEHVHVFHVAIETLPDMIFVSHAFRKYLIKCDKQGELMTRPELIAKASAKCAGSGSAYIFSSSIAHSLA